MGWGLVLVLVAVHGVLTEWCERCTWAQGLHDSGAATAGCLQATRRCATCVSPFRCGTVVEPVWLRRQALLETPGRAGWLTEHGQHATQR